VSHTDKEGGSKHHLYNKKEAKVARLTKQEQQTNNRDEEEYKRDTYKGTHRIRRVEGEEE
jgi:hypothetical protein